ncbi:MAG: glycosyltransferase [Candidatus Latescibacteria bacterium]|nr:glycosyltransferase [Candidatus Latescibacterota bacterium]
MDLSIVIVSYNTRDLLEQTLRTVTEAIGSLAVEVFVVDNASRDGSPDMVAERFPWVRLIRSHDNLGFAGGNNLALAQVTGRYIMLLNSDTIIRLDTLSSLVEFMDAHPQAGAAGAKILNPDGTLQLSCRRGFPTPMAAFCKLSGLSRLFPNSPRLARYNLTFLDPETAHEVDALSGSCMIVRKEAMDQVGPLDESYFFYGEDLDWCFCMKEAGWKIYYTPATEIIHFKGESSRAEEMRFRYRFYEAMSIFVQKHMQRRYRFFPLWVLHLGIVLYGSLSFVATGLKRLLLPLFDGALVLVGIELALSLRYHPRFFPLVQSIETLSRQLGLDAQPTRWPTPPLYTDLQWFLVYAIPLAIWLLAFYSLGLYQRHKLSTGRAALSVALGFAGILTLVFFFKSYQFSRLAASVAWICNTGLVVGWRWGAARLAHNRGRQTRRRRFLLVGTDNSARELLETLERMPEADGEIVGLIAPQQQQRGSSLAGKPVIGVVDDLPQLVRDFSIDDLIFTANTVSHCLTMGQGPRRLQIRLIPDAFGILPQTRAATRVDQLPLIKITPPKG